MSLLPVVLASFTHSAQAQTPPEWSYNPAGKRDPFAAIYGPVVEGGGPEATGMFRWAPEQLVVTGVLDSATGPRAMVVDPEGTAYVLRPGSYVGKNWGKVSAISEAGVVVTTEYRTGDGDLVLNALVMRLR
ncbi:hypothetical protein LBMAG42_44180 [Deltaproteobacteria bacterium]|nr:hypothetical protein LBMAG42_44180 [Deltaproteobacteria bacterium]